MQPVTVLVVFVALQVFFFYLARTEPERFRRARPWLVVVSLLTGVLLLAWAALEAAR